MKNAMNMKDMKGGQVGQGRGGRNGKEPRPAIPDSRRSNKGFWALQPKQLPFLERHMPPTFVPIGYISSELLSTHQLVGKGGLVTC